MAGEVRRFPSSRGGREIASLEAPASFNDLMEELFTMIANRDEIIAWLLQSALDGETLDRHACEALLADIRSARETSPEVQKIRAGHEDLKWKIEALTVDEHGSSGEDR